MKNVGNAIRKLREFKGLRRQHLADEIGVSLKTFSNFENGLASPSVEILEKVANALNVNLLHLFSFDDKVITHDKSIQLGGANKTDNDQNHISEIERELYEKLIAEKEHYIKGLEQQITLLIKKE